jgi:hypothetical protein
LPTCELDNRGTLRITELPIDIFMSQSAFFFDANPILPLNKTCPVNGRQQFSVRETNEHNLLDREPSRARAATLIFSF